MQGYEPTCAYILSNGWYLKKSKSRVESNDPFNRLSKIDYSQRDYDYNMKVDDTLDFLQRIRIDKGLKYDPPSENLMIVRALSAGGADVSFVNINSDKGHDAFLLEEPEFDDAMRGFINSVSLEANI